MSYKDIYPNEERLVCELMERGWHISCAESCTGGMVASRIIDVPNASAVIEQSFVTYSDEAKKELLGVSSETIKKHDVVSEEVALEMVKGLSDRTGSEVCISVTGYAGPYEPYFTDGSRIEIGTVCFGFYIGGIYTTRQLNLGNIGRELVRKTACEYAIATAADILKKRKE